MKIYYYDDRAYKELADVIVPEHLLEPCIYMGKILERDDYVIRQSFQFDTLEYNLKMVLTGLANRYVKITGNRFTTEEKTITWEFQSDGHAVTLRSTVC